MLILLSAGSNAQGQLGNCSLEDSDHFQACSFAGAPPHTMPLGTKRIVDLAAGANHTLILLEMEDGINMLWGAGDGRKGQLGLKYQNATFDGISHDVFRRLELTLESAGLGGYAYKSIAATWETSYAVLYCAGKNDVLISFGSDDFGDLGIGGLKRKHQIKDFHVVSFDHLFPYDGMKVISLFPGQRHIIAHLQSSSSSLLVGWGSSRHGQLGLPADSPFSSLPRIISTGSDLNCQGKVFCALGIHHSIIWNGSDRVITLGSDRKGQLQVVNQPLDHSRLIQHVDCTWNGTYVVTNGEGGWKVHSSGSNSHGQTGWTTSSGFGVGIVEFPRELETNASVVIACGSEHVLALLKPSGHPQNQRAQVWGWGWNEHGNLGLGHTEDVATPVRLWPKDDGVLDIRGIWAGSGTSWICAEVSGDYYS